MVVAATRGLAGVGKVWGCGGVVEANVYTRRMRLIISLARRMSEVKRKIYARTEINIDYIKGKD